MNVQSINNDIKTKQWIKTIKECRESGLPVKTWCKQNNIVDRMHELMIQETHIHCDKLC